MTRGFHILANGPWRWRSSALGLALVLLLAACGSVGVNGGPNSAASGVGSPGDGTPPLNAPTISGTPAASVSVGQAYSFSPSASGGDGSALTFAIVNLPSWASFDSSSGQLTGTPAASDIGTVASIQISVTDGQSTATLPAFSITVVNALQLSGSPSTSALVGQPYAFQPSSNATPGTALTFSVQNQPTWTNFDSTTGQLSGTPAQAGTFSNIVISATDGIQTATLAAFNITVTAPTSSSPPTIIGTPPTSVTAGSLYTFTPQASDPAGKPLTFSIQNQPAWATFSTSTGALIGTPTSAQAGTYAGVVISVSDGSQTASLAPFSVKVVAPLRISGSPATQVVAGQSYSFVPTTSASAGSLLTFSIQNRPAWATFSGATGLLAEPRAPLRRAPTRTSSSA